MADVPWQKVRPLGMSRATRGAMAGVQVGEVAGQERTRLEESH